MKFSTLIYLLLFDQIFLKLFSLCHIKPRVFNGTLVPRKDLKFIATLFHKALVKDFEDRHKQELWESAEDLSANKITYIYIIGVGIVLSPWYVLTNYKCITFDLIMPDKWAKLLEKFMYVSRTHNLEFIKGKRNVHYKVREIHRHPFYALKTNEFGVADTIDSMVILKLASSFKNMEKNEKACLPADNRFTFHNLKAAGFGFDWEFSVNPKERSYRADESVILESAYEPRENRLRSVQMRRVQTNYVMCANDPNSVCAKNDEAGLCVLDLALPLLSYDIQNTVTVLGISEYVITKNPLNAECGPGFITRFSLIYPHLNWIRRFVGKELCLISTNESSNTTEASRTGETVKRTPIEERGHTSSAPVDNKRLKEREKKTAVLVLFLIIFMILMGAIVAFIAYLAMNKRNILTKKTHINRQLFPRDKSSSTTVRNYKSRSRIRSHA